MIGELWENGERTEASAVCDRLLPGSRGVDLWTDTADTTREWKAADDGLKASDTRVRFKDGREYHGMEDYAWQYFVTAQFSDASDWFYVAAVWRSEDMEAILDENPGHTPDQGHLTAIETCVRMARFAKGLAAARSAGTAQPHAREYGLIETKVRRGEAKAQRAIDRALAVPGRAVPLNRDVVLRTAAGLKRRAADGLA